MYNWYHMLKQKIKELLACTLLKNKLKTNQYLFFFKVSYCVEDYKTKTATEKQNRSLA